MKSLSRVAGKVLPAQRASSLRCLALLSSPKSSAHFYPQAVDFEKESNNVVKFSVPTRSVARILGKSGATINEIKDTTGAQIDVDKASDDNSKTNIQVRGTKTAIAEAKAAILAISEQVVEETTVDITVESRFHRTLIGAGGQGLKDLIIRCGGPSDPKIQAGLVRL